jgi:hypothetical protein
MLAEFRGMINWSFRYEWGGYSDKGTWEFSQMRPKWDLPIHQLMVKTNVTIFFQGHDHLFCKEEKDGIIYQEVPQPSTMARASNPDASIAAQYLGQVLPSSGYLRIHVSPQNVTVEYVKTGLTNATEVPISYVVQPSAITLTGMETATSAPTLTMPSTTPQETLFSSSPTPSPNPASSTPTTQPNPTLTAFVTPTLHAPTSSVISEMSLQITLAAILIASIAAFTLARKLKKTNIQN